MISDLQKHLDKWIRRFRLTRSVCWAAYGLVAGLSGAVFLAGYTFVSRNVLENEFLSGAAGASLTGLALGWLAGYFWPILPLRAARKFDRLFALKERVSTALELHTSGVKSVITPEQLRDAVSRAARVDERQRIPVRIPGGLLLIALVLSAANAALFFYGDAAFSAAREKRQVQGIIQAQAAEIEKLIAEIESNPGLTETQKEILTEALEQALEELAEAESLEEAFSTLEEAGQKLETLQDPGADALAEGLRQAGEALQDGESGPLDRPAESLAGGDLKQAAEDLRDLDATDMDPDELEKLAEQLESLAGAVEAAGPALAEALRAAARAAREGDAEAAERALEQAAASLEDLAEQAAASQAAGDAAAAVEESRESIVAAGQEPGASQNTRNPGDNTGDQGQDGPNAAGGAGDGPGANGSQTGPEAGSDPISQANSPDGGGQSDLQPISLSSIGGEGGDTVVIPPSGEEGDTITGVGPADSGENDSITVPYIDVLPPYQRAANEAIDSGVVPAQYRDLVRDYFSSLER